MPFDRSTACVTILCRIIAFKLQSLELMIYSENGLVFCPYFWLKLDIFSLSKLGLRTGWGCTPGIS